MFAVRCHLRTARCRMDIGTISYSASCVAALPKSTPQNVRIPGNVVCPLVSVPIHMSPHPYALDGLDKSARCPVLPLSLALIAVGFAGPDGYGGGRTIRSWSPLLSAGIESLNITMSCTTSLLLERSPSLSSNGHKQLVSVLVARRRAMGVAEVELGVQEPCEIKTKPEGVG